MMRRLATGSIVKIPVHTTHPINGRSVSQARTEHPHRTAAHANGPPVQIHGFRCTLAIGPLHMRTVLRLRCTIPRPLTARRQKAMLPTQSWTPSQSQGTVGASAARSQGAAQEITDGSRATASADASSPIVFNLQRPLPRRLPRLVMPWLKS